MSSDELSEYKEEPKSLNPINIRLSDSLFSKELAPHYMKLASQLATSELVPKSYRGKPQDLFLCWALGHQIGIPPEQAMNCIMVLNGRAVMWGDEMLALCMAHSDFIDIIEEPICGKAGEVIGYCCIIKRKGRTDHASVFTMDMAKRAGLLAKGGVWAQYPERMLKLRARGFALRDAFPDALKGIKSREEVEDYIEVDYVVDDKKNTRTEQLKKELNNVDQTQNQATALENTEIKQENVSHARPGEENNAFEEKTEVHSTIKRLLAEKKLSEERLTKALSYFEVATIEDLEIDAGIEFINQLIKL